MQQSMARVQTERAGIHLQQLCKHFAHKLPVEFTPENGEIRFSIGTCRLAAKDRVLTLSAEAADDDVLAQLPGRRGPALAALRVPRSAHDRVADRRRGRLTGRAPPHPARVPGPRHF